MYRTLSPGWVAVGPISPQAWGCTASVGLSPSTAAPQSPHRRGDVPHHVRQEVSGIQSPHRRGDVPEDPSWRPWYRNLPTGVGMYRTSRLVQKSPHRRGDVPIAKRPPELGQISPQAWGCTEPIWRPICVSISESPHRRGDVPKSGFLSKISPQAWGCTDQLISWYAFGGHNLPTGVGMYRSLAAPSLAGPQSPHRRGDVPR